jgi:DNA-binding IclR family transcriptional regulator
MGLAGLRGAIDAVQLVALRKGVTVRELAEALGLPRSTAHRLVAGLAAVGLIQREGASGRYVLGTLMGELAGGPAAWQQLMVHCRPQMDALRNASGETVALHVLHAERRVLLDQSESLHEHRWVYSNPRVPMPLHAGAAAKMLLALLPEADMNRLVRRDRLVAFTRNTPRDRALLAREIARIRMRRYAISAQEVSPGIASIAVPVLAEPWAGQPFAVMSLTGPSVRLTEKVLKGYLPKLQMAAKRAADRLARAVGGRAEAA